MLQAGVTCADGIAQRTFLTNLSEESLLETIRNIVFTLPRNTARAAFQGTSDYETPTDTITNLLLSLQASDNWNKGKA